MTRNSRGTSHRTFGRNFGFTIIELLIVVVVIGVLAGIVVVAFNGIQARANNSAKISTINSLVRLIRGYMTTYDAYPSTGVFCATIDNECTNNSGTVQTTDNSALMAELRKIGTPPRSNNATAGSSYGVQYIYESANTFNGIPAPVRLEYWLQGDNVPCGTGNIQNNTVAAASVTSSTPYTSSSSGKTVCWVRLGLNT